MLFMLAFFVLACGVSVQENFLAFLASTEVNVTATQVVLLPNLLKQVKVEVEENELTQVSSALLKNLLKYLT